MRARNALKRGFGRPSSGIRASADRARPIPPAIAGAAAAANASQ
jgi:hypothetical protein